MERGIAAGKVILMPLYREQKLLGECMPLKEHKSVEVYFLELPFPLDFTLEC